ncbi:Ornithine decarboxylase, putative [Perkinsus marinus ATCC 50983]|uniref:ornithine decarboxylase n=1 Tax=Perkinsus marinus (strain ATCC 50983 / TXsc) TaxID=423536 RepID=C5K7Y2_PERM5|nr:Ornithine decarboxylase, putative [Perkinsus marinus ATCC 50983]EER19667.1 Ornithine decarboxylase, putative [Perkinsus marinus ATCC 50983]|eukprot:XP_002787871.1 Ornithine decarboxylase, putative [Perkinsus marinus ATCC 50983]
MTCSSILKKENNNVVHQVHVPKPLDPIQYVAGEALRDLADPDVSVMLLDLGQLEHQMRRWKDLLPRVTPYYAVKCNPEPMLVKTLYRLGCKFDCATINEMRLVRNILSDDIGTTEGFDVHEMMASHVVYANPTKLPSQLVGARDLGVEYLVADSASEIAKIAHHHPKAKLLLRLACVDNNAQCPMSAKFGASLGVTVTVLLEEAMKHGVNVVGVSFHVGSGCSDVHSITKALVDAREVFDAAASRYGLRLSVLDIGGGFQGVDREGSPVAFKSMATVVNSLLDTLFPDPDDVQVIAEPGRYFACSPCSLVTKIYSKNVVVSAPKLSEMKSAADIAEEDTMDSGSSSSSASVDELAGKNLTSLTRLYLNDGVYGSFNCILYDHQQVWPEALHEESGVCGDPKVANPTHVLFGPTCDGFDTIMNGVTHLPEMEIGHHLLWRNMGAYTTAAATNFNGFDTPMYWYYRTTFHDC